MTRNNAIIWAPRIAGLALAVFLAMFGLDAFSQERGILSSVVGVSMGLLPAVITLIAVRIGWKHEGIAALLFFIGAVFYAVTTREHPGWIAVIATPLLVIGILFTISWRTKAK